MPLTENQVVEFLNSYPEYDRTLNKAIIVEDLNLKFNPTQYYGWQWSDVGTMGSKLVRLVTNDIALINFKSNRSTLYRLSNREVVRKGLREYEGKKLANEVSRSFMEGFNSFETQKKKV